LLHADDAGGPSALDVDHFNPQLKNRYRHKFSNLMLAATHCNSKKLNNWPTTGEQRAGVRFLNPTTEKDYGPHIIEDFSTGKLIGLTPAGRYHIRTLDLNAPFFVRHRKERTELLQSLQSQAFHFSNASFQGIQELIDRVKKILARQIPELPSHSAGSASQVSISTQ
jgi:hypothetical protein